MPKNRKPLSALEQWRNLCDALAEDALKDDRPLTKAEQGELDRLKAELVQFAEGYAARSEAKNEGGSQWQKKETRRKASRDSTPEKWRT